MSKKDIKKQAAKNIGDGISKRIIETGRKINKEKNSDPKPKTGRAK